MVQTVLLPVRIASDPHLPSPRIVVSCSTASGGVGLFAIFSNCQHVTTPLASVLDRLLHGYMT